MRHRRERAGWARVVPLLIVVVFLAPDRPLGPIGRRRPPSRSPRCRLADPGLDDPAGRVRARRDQPRGDRLGRARPALRRRDDRLPRRPAGRPAQASRGPRRRRPVRARRRSSPTASPTRAASSPGTAACSSPPRPTCSSSRTPTATARPTSGRSSSPASPRGTSSSGSTARPGAWTTGSTWPTAAAAGAVMFRANFEKFTGVEPEVAAAGPTV